VSAETKSMHYSNTVESLVAALESKLGDDDKDYSKKDKRKYREKEIDEEFESIFKTKIRWDHLAEKH
jgi:hypothetical protein